MGKAGGKDATPRLGIAHSPDPAQVELILSQLDSLPTLSTVAVRLLQVTGDDSSSARDISRLIETDPSLTSRLLSLTRRAHVGQDVNTVERAVVLLGFEAVRNLVLSLEVFETFSHRTENDSTRFDRAGFWKHSLAVGCAAKLLAQTDGLRKAAVAGSTPASGRRLNEHAAEAGGRMSRRGRSGQVPTESDRSVPEDVFCCGLLHDLGKVALSACFPKTYDRAVEQADTLFGNIADAEFELLGVDHPLVGRRLAMHWQLPEMMTQCIWLHHHDPDLMPAAISFPHHVRLVRAADWLVRQMRIGYSGNHTQDGQPAESWLLKWLSPQELDRVRADLPELVESRAELIGLSTLTSKVVYQEALSRANAELAQTNARLMSLNRELESHANAYHVLRSFREALGARASHEDICRAAAQASPHRVVILANLPHRKSVLLVAKDDEAGSVKMETVPLTQAGNLQELAVDQTGWRILPRLNDALQERIQALLGPQTPQVLPLITDGWPAGAIVAAQPLPSDIRNTLSTLGDWVLQWLRSAEACQSANQLSEELTNLNRRLANSQEVLARMRSLNMIGEMAAGAAHELNNPLAVISGRAQMLRQQATPEQVQRSADLIAEHAQKASSIVSELMEFAKPSPPSPTVWNLRAMLLDIRQAVVQSGALKADQFIVDVSDNAPAVYADAVQSRKLSDEVIRNAIEAMANVSAPRLVINCQTDVADEEIVIRIEDNGAGMSPEVLEHAMDPFFSHRTAGRGRGLGLSRAVRYAEVNGGRIRLASRLGEGTTALIWLPIARGQQ